MPSSPLVRRSIHLLSAKPCIGSVGERAQHEQIECAVQEVFGVAWHSLPPPSGGRRMGLAGLACQARMPASCN